jgi:ABC-2 type transport system ATP-binding protein
MIQTDNLTKAYNELVAVDKLNLSVEEGDVYGFIGPNGAGKTTTLRMLATLLAPTSGNATVCGYKIVGESRKIRHLIGYMPDFFGIYEDMRLHEYLEFFASSYRIRGAERKKIVADVLELTDLTFKSESVIRELSRGMQQRLGLARVLIHDPKVLILDEPASGLDPRARIEIRELIRELRSMGKTILISSHILHELGEICNRIGIIEKGRLVFQGGLDAVMEEARSKGVLFVSVEKDADGAVKALIDHPKVKEAAIEEGRIRVTLEEDVDDFAFISALLVEKGFGITHLKEEEIDLEDVFIRMTRGIVS